MAWITREWFEGGERRTEKTDTRMAGTSESDRFVVEWREGSKRRRKKIKRPGRVGKREAVELMHQLNAGIGPDDDTKTQNDWAEFLAAFEDNYLTTRKRPSTRIELKRTLNHLTAWRVPASIDSVNAEFIAAFAAYRLNECNVEAATVNKDLRNVRTILNRAVDWGYLDRKPAIHFLDEDESDSPIYTAAEVVAMYDAAKHATLPSPLNDDHRAQWWRAAIALLWETGGRRGDLIDGPKWSDLDIESRVILIRSTSEKKGRYKAVYFGDWSAMELEKLGEFLRWEEILPWPHHGPQMNKQLARIQKAAKIDETRKNLKFHAFRRTVGDMTTEAHGLAAAQHKLNHTSASVTAKHYAIAAVRRLAASVTAPPPAEIAKRMAKKEGK